MIYVGIDVAKDKHDRFITDSDADVLLPSFINPNNRKGFDALYQKILGFLFSKGLPTYVVNPLHTNLYRKSLSLRKTKTGKA